MPLKATRRRFLRPFRPETGGLWDRNSATGMPLAPRAFTRSPWNKLGGAKHPIHPGRHAFFGRQEGGRPGRQ